MPLLKLHTNRLLVLLCGLFFSTLHAQIYNTEVEGSISLLDNGEYIQVEGLAFNKTSIIKSLRSVLSVINNDSITGYKKDQNDRFILAPNGERSLTGPTIPSGNTDRLIVLLLIYDNEDNLLGMDRVVLNGDGTDEVKKVVMSKSSFFNKDSTGSWVIRGLTAEETKTKFGRDFYNYFMEKYRDSELKGDELVTIKETFALANTTKIEVILGNNTKLLEFVLPPRDNVIREYAEATYNKVMLHFRNKEKNRNSLIRY